MSDVGELDEDTVNSVLNMVSPDFSQDYVQRNLWVWTEDSMAEEVTSDASHSVTISSSPIKPLASSPSVPLLQIQGDPIKSILALMQDVNNQQRQQRYPIRQWVDRISAGHLDSWGDIVEEALLLLLPLEERARARSSKAKPPPVGTKILNRNQKRMAEYKKVQDLYQKNRRLLADKIVSGEPLDVPAVRPSMELVMTVHDGILQSAPPPDDHAFTLK